MTIELLSKPIHRHNGNFYNVKGKFKAVVKETEDSYIIEFEDKEKKIVIPKVNSIALAYSLYDLEDDLVFFPILRHDIGQFALIFIDRNKV